MEEEAEDLDVGEEDGRGVEDLHRAEWSRFQMEPGAAPRPLAPPPPRAPSPPLRPPAAPRPPRAEEGRPLPRAGPSVPPLSSVSDVPASLVIGPGRLEQERGLAEDSRRTGRYTIEQLEESNRKLVAQNKKLLALLTQERNERVRLEDKLSLLNDLKASQTEGGTSKIEDAEIRKGDTHLANNEIENLSSFINANKVQNDKERNKPFETSHIQTSDLSRALILLGTLGTQMENSFTALKTGLRQLEAVAEIIEEGTSAAQGRLLAAENSLLGLRAFFDTQDETEEQLKSNVGL